MKSIVTLNEPKYVGMSILNISRHHMCSLYHEITKPKYDIRMLNTDTDSFVLHSKAEHICDDLLHNLWTSVTMTPSKL